MIHGIKLCRTTYCERGSFTHFSTEKEIAGYLDRSTSPDEVLNNSVGPVGSRVEKETRLSRAIGRSEFRSDRGKREPGARARASASHVSAREDHRLDTCTRT